MRWPPYAIYILSLKLDKTVIVRARPLLLVMITPSWCRITFWSAQHRDLAWRCSSHPWRDWHLAGVWLHKRISEKLFYQASYTYCFVLPEADCRRSGFLGLTWQTGSRGGHRLELNGIAKGP